MKRNQTSAALIAAAAIIREALAWTFDRIADRLAHGVAIPGAAHVSPSAGSLPN